MLFNTFAVNNWIHGQVGIVMIFGYSFNIFYAHIFGREYEEEKFLACFFFLYTKSLYFQLPEHYPNYF